MLTRRYCDLAIESVLQIIVVDLGIRMRSNDAPLSLMLLVAGTINIPANNTAHITKRTDNESGLQ